MLVYTKIWWDKVRGCNVARLVLALFHLRRLFYMYRKGSGDWPEELEEADEDKDEIGICLPEERCKDRLYDSSLRRFCLKLLKVLLKSAADCAARKRQRVSWDKKRREETGLFVKNTQNYLWLHTQTHTYPKWVLLDSSQLKHIKVGIGPIGLHAERILIRVQFTTILKEIQY